MEAEWAKNCKGFETAFHTLLLKSTGFSEYFCSNVDITMFSLSLNFLIWSSSFWISHPWMVNFSDGTKSVDGEFRWSYSNIVIYCNAILNLAFDSRWQATSPSSQLQAPLLKNEFSNPWKIFWLPVPGKFILSLPSMPKEEAKHSSASN